MVAMIRGLLLAVLSLASLAAALAQAAGANPRYVIVGGTNQNFNYAWNPAVNLAYWAANVRVYIGDYLGKRSRLQTEGAHPNCVFLRHLCFNTSEIFYWSVPSSSSPVFQYPSHTDEIYLFNSFNDLRACNYANAVRVCRDWSGDGAGCNVQAKQQGVLYVGSGVYTRCMRNLKVHTD